MNARLPKRKAYRTFKAAGYTKSCPEVHARDSALPKMAGVVGVTCVIRPLHPSIASK
jgi:hypothetical protein